jgi:hypothetical protein
MAATTRGVLLTDRHRGAQLALRAVFLTELHRLWPLLDPLRLTTTASAWLDLAVGLVLGYRTRSAEISLSYYDRFRTAETRHPPIETATIRSLLTPVDPAAVQTSLLVTGPGTIIRQLGRGADPEQADRKALVAVSGAASRHVLNGGRDALDTAVAHDAVALGYARVTGPNPCAFCAVLASRGPVYTSAASAAGAKDYHDFCMCTVEAVYDADAPWPGRAREFEALWEKTSAEYSKNGPMNQFRRAYEGRSTPQK